MMKAVVNQSSVQTSALGAWRANMAASRTQRGQVFPLVAIALAVLLGAAGLAVDVGYHRFEQRLQQSAVDSAALAGAAEIAFGDPVAAARRDAASNGFADGVKGVSVAVNPAYSSAYTGANTAVEVVISAPHATFFEHVFGINSVSVTTRAVAELADSVNCLYLLQTNPPNGSNLNDATINAPNCNIIINQSSAPNMQGVTIDAPSIGYNSSSSSPNENKASFTQATPAPAIPASDPCPQIPGCAALTNNPPLATGCVAYKGLGPLTQGCYSSIDVRNSGNATVTFQPGTYVITGTFNGGGSKLAGNGVTFYITGGGKVNLNGALLNFSAPTTGSYAGMLFYQTTSDANDANLEGASCKVPGCVSGLDGVLYFPTQFVNYTHAGGGFDVLIFGSANFNKSESDITSPPSGTSPLKQAVLAE